MPLVSFELNHLKYDYSFLSFTKLLLKKKGNRSLKCFSEKHVFYFFILCRDRNTCLLFFHTLYWSGITSIFDPITDLGLITEFDIEHLQRVRHANRGRLLLRTPGPVRIWDLQVF